MKIKYDPEVDAAYISFKKGPTQVTTIRVTEDLAIDFGPKEEIVGIEILDASQHLDLSRENPLVELENLKAALKELVPQEYIGINVKAFDLGYQALTGHV